jgi:hypothetical protein
MNKIALYSILISSFLSFYTDGVIAQVSINTDNSPPSDKAMLDVKSTTKGTHITRMTTAQRTALATDQSDVGLMVFDLDKNRLYLFDGQNWLPFAVGNINEILLTNRAASDGAANDNFGLSVSISGDYAIVGAYLADVGAHQDQGAAYIYQRAGGIWTQQAKLFAADGAANDHFGLSVSLAGDYAIVGADNKIIGSKQGAAYIFFRNGNTWLQQVELTASDGESEDRFGCRVSISGDYALVGANYKSIGANFYQGGAYIFYRSGGTWTQHAVLTSSDGVGGSLFGSSVSILGDYAVVGALNALDDLQINYVGATYVFKLSSTLWMEVAKLTASDGAQNDNFGGSVSIFGDYIIVGAPNADVDGKEDQGAAYIFYRMSGNNWVEQAKLTNSDGKAFDYFAPSVSISGDYAIVGAAGNDIGSNTNQGAAYLFKRNGTSWEEKKKLTNTVLGFNDALLGNAVGITPSACIIGENNGINPITGVRTGAVYFTTIDF